MLNIGDTVILNKKKEDCPMITNGGISEEKWNKIISCKVVFIGMGEMYRVRDGYDYEHIVHKDDFTIEK